MSRTSKFDGAFLQFSWAAIRSCRPIQPGKKNVAATRCCSIFRRKGQGRRRRVVRCSHAIGINFNHDLITVEACSAVILKRHVGVANHGEIAIYTIDGLRGRKGGRALREGNANLRVRIYNSEHHGREDQDEARKIL